MTARQYTEELRIQHFIDWLQAGGATFPSVEIRTVNGLRGVYATKKIMSGELIYHIPRHLMVTAELARNSPVGQRIAALHHHVSACSYILAFLLENRREKGFWLPCIDALPTQCSTLIGFHRHAHAVLLKGSLLQSEACLPGSTFRETMLAEYRKIAPLFECLTLREFVTIFLLLLSRMFYLDLDGNRTIVMVPFADMPNHAVPEQAKWSPFASQGFTCTALQDIKCGEQVNISYGKKSNGELLFSHGFCIENNRYNLVEIALPAIRPSHPFFERTKALGERRGHRRVFVVSLNHQAPNTQRMFSYLRMACLEDMQALRCAVAAAASSSILPEVSRKNERAALDALSAACKQGMNGFERTLEEDERLLEDDGLGWIERCAVMVGQGEKRILQHYWDLATAG